MSDQDRLRFNEVAFSYVENTVDLPLFAQLVDELAQDFITVRVARHWAGPMATPLFGDTAITFLLGAASGPFLAELSKDLYRSLRAGLFSLYQAARTWANNRGYAPFAIEQETDHEDSACHFTFPQGLDQQQFEDAILSIPDAMADYTERSGFVGFVYTGDHWQLDEEA